jgi:hypothetical protein
MIFRFAGNSPLTIHRAQFTAHILPCKIHRRHNSSRTILRRHHSTRHNSPWKNKNSPWWVLDSTRLLLDDCWVSDIWVLHSTWRSLHCSRWLLNSAKSLLMMLNDCWQLDDYWILLEEWLKAAIRLSDHC